MKKCFLFLFCLLSVALPLSAWRGEDTATMFVDLEVIELNKEKAQNGNEVMQDAIDRLNAKALQMMSAGPFSVVYSEKNSPYGSLHDYCSMSPYWWPDPEKQDGLPYIRKDGEVNPERNEYDKAQSSGLGEAVEILTTAYLYTGNEKYAKRAAELLKIWFIEEETRMNPNMNFAQFVPGRNKGRNYGIIESRVFMYSMDYAAALFNSAQLDKKSYDKLLEWSKTFLNWLLISDHGKKERNTNNNHGSWYDMQTLGFAIMVGNEEAQYNLVSEYIEKRIKGNILKDGRQPEELERTRSFFYSAFNLNAITKFYSMAEKNKLLTKKQSKTIKKGILRGANYLYAAALDPEKWEYQQIRSFDGGRMQLAQIYFELDKLFPEQGFWEKAMLIPQEDDNRIALMLKYNLFTEKK